MNYFVRISPKSPNVGARPQTPFRFDEQSMCKDSTLIEHFWFMLMLGNFGEKYVIFSALSLSKNRFCIIEGADIYWRRKQIQHFSKKNWNIARNIMCFIMNVIIGQTKLFSPAYLSFSMFSYRQNMFWSRNLSPNMPKISSFSLKNRKNHSALEALPLDPLCLWRLGDTPDPHISLILLRISHYTLDHNRRFHVS